jgi:hypothetical protein
MQHVNRVQPVGPASAYKTFTVAAPIGTHWRDASCAEVECEARRHGWRTVVDEATELGQRQAGYIRRECLSVLAPAQPEDQRRRYVETTEHGMTVFTFPAGQTCFEAHKVPLERPEFYVVREGDWRGNPRGIAPRRMSGPDPWLNEFGEHQDRISRALNG